MTTTTSQSNVAQSPSTSELAPRIGQMLEDYGEIVAIAPVLAGLFVTSRLRLRGAQALLVNLTIAAVVRQVVGQLKQQASQSPETSNTVTVAENGSQPIDPDEDYTILHSVPGRIRLRIPRLKSDAFYAKRLKNLLSENERVKYVRVNRAASSLLIQYDGEGLSELELGMYLLKILEQSEQETAA